MILALLLGCAPNGLTADELRLLGPELDAWEQGVLIEPESVSLCPGSGACADGNRYLNAGRWTVTLRPDIRAELPEEKRVAVVQWRCSDQVIAEDTVTGLRDGAARGDLAPVHLTLEHLQTGCEVRVSSDLAGETRVSVLLGNGVR